MMRTPDEIKKGLECCVDSNVVCTGNCVFDDDVKLGYPDCVKLLMTNAFSYIQQLEAERDAAVKDMPTSCMLCKHFQKKYNTCNSKKPCDRIGGVRTEWKWRGVQKEVP